jgi:hypothetical protein
MTDNRTHFDKLHALSSSVIGFEFEFYTNMLKGRAAESLSKLINKKVVVSERYHSNIVVDANTCKLEPDYSGGSKMMEFITGPLPYNEAIPILIKVLNWIDENGWTTDRCAFQFSVSFDKFRKDVKDRMENLDKLKFILGLDENFIYSKFGNRSKNVYAKSIKRVVPRNRFSMVENLTSIDPRMFKVPEDKYYGVNFTKIPKGYLEFRYLGNRDYQKKTKDIREIIDYVLLYLYDLLSHRISGYSKEDLAKLQSMMNQYTKVVRSFSDPEFFFRNFPDFHIFIDLKGWDENVKTYWSVIRDKIFDIIVEGNVTSGYFNYDTTTGRSQLKDARSREALELKDIDLILCDIKNGIIKNCNIYSSKIRKSSIEQCYIVRDNTVISSKVKDCVVDFGNELEDCFIDCAGKSINCKIKDGVLRAGEIGENADISKETLKVKGFEDLRKERFVTDSRLKDLNNRYNNPRFGNMNF